jgi:hypothetical protein
MERYGQPDKTIQGYLAYIGSPICYDGGGDLAAGQASYKLSQVIKSREFAATNFPLKFYVKEALEHLING